MKKQKTKRITVSVSPEIYAQIEREAKESGIQLVSVVARQALVFYLNKKATLRTIREG